MPVAVAVAITVSALRLRWAHDVRSMQERRTLQADIDKYRLHARHHPLHAPLVDVADITATGSTLDVHFLQHAVFDHPHSRLTRGDIDQDLFAHRLLHVDTDLYSGWARGLSMLGAQHPHLSTPCRNRPAIT